MDPDQDFTLAGVLGIDRLVVSEILCRSFVGIEAQEILFLGVGAVTDKAFVREDGQNLPGKIDRPFVFSEDELVAGAGQEREDRYQGYRFHRVTLLL